MISDEKAFKIFSTGLGGYAVSVTPFAEIMKEYCPDITDAEIKDTRVVSVIGFDSYNDEKHLTATYLKSKVKKADIDALMVTFLAEIVELGLTAEPIYTIVTECKHERTHCKLCNSNIFKLA